MFSPFSLDTAADVAGIIRGKITKTTKRIGSLQSFI